MITLMNNFALSQSQIKPNQNPISAKSNPAAKLTRTPKQDELTFGISGHQIAEEYLRKAQHFTLGDDLLQPVLGRRFFHEMPSNLFFAMRNSQSRHIINTVPKGLQDCGLPTEEILIKLDKIAALLQTNMHINYKSFKIGNLLIPVKDRKYNGEHGIVYKLGIGHQNFALKSFRHHRVYSHGPYGEIGMAREFAKGNVADTPHFCIASPHQYSSWMLTPYVERTTPSPQGISYANFLRQNSLSLEDTNKANKIAGRDSIFLVDFGGITIAKEDPYVKAEVNRAVEKIQGNHPPFFEMAKDEGLRIPALKEFWHSSATEYSTTWAKIKKTLGFKYGPSSIIETPEAQFLETLNSSPYKTLKRQQGALQKIGAQIDVLGDFSVD